MGKLIYLVTTSVDGYFEDEKGKFDWTTPSEEVLEFVDSVLSNVGTFLLGRRMFETLRIWETIPVDGSNEGMNRFAKIWKEANKIVYSNSFENVTTANTKIEHAFKPEELNKYINKSDKDFNIGGPQLASQAIKAGIIDEFHQIINPIILGGGSCWLPKEYQAGLELVELNKFKNGCVHIEYKLK